MRARYGQNFHEKKNSMNASIASPLMMGDSTLYASAMVARRDIRGRTRPKLAWHTFNYLAIALPK